MRLQGVMLVVLSVVCILQDMMTSMVLSAVDHASMVSIVLSAVDNVSVVSIVVLIQ